jgi:hypothetical protein
MAKLHDDWKVLPHGRLTEVEPRLLTVVGTVKMPLGKFPRRMTIVGLSRNRTAIFSPIPLGDREMKRIEALGKPEYMIVPNGYHRLDSRAWKKRYPEIQVLCPPGAKERVEEAVAVDSTSDILSDRAVDFVTIDGTDEAESALIVRRAHGVTVIVNDIIADVRHPKGLGANVMARLFGFGVKRPRIPREVRHSFIKDEEALAAQLRGWAEIVHLKRLIPSHGDIIDRPKRVLQRIADSLGS